MIQQALPTPASPPAHCPVHWERHAFFPLDMYFAFTLETPYQLEAHDGPWSLKVWDESSCKEEAEALLHGPAPRHHRGHGELRA